MIDTDRQRGLSARHSKTAADFEEALTKAARRRMRVVAQEFDDPFIMNGARCCSSVLPVGIGPFANSHPASDLPLMKAGFVASLPQVAAECLRVRLVWRGPQGFQWDKPKWQKGNATVPLRPSRRRRPSPAAGAPEYAQDYRPNLWPHRFTCRCAGGVAGRLAAARRAVVSGGHPRGGGSPPRYRPPSAARCRASPQSWPLVEPP